MEGNNQVIGNAGMYLAAYHLSRRGWNVMPTSRNARGIDLLVYDVTAKTKLGIQIKTLSKSVAAVPLGTKSIDNLMGDWWIIVASLATEPVCYILKPKEVAKRAVRDKARKPIGFREKSMQSRHLKRSGNASGMVTSRVEGSNFNPLRSAC